MASTALWKSYQTFHSIIKPSFRFSSTFFRGAYLNEFGKPLEVKEGSSPYDCLSPGKVKIKVNYCTLNKTDVDIINGDMAVDAKLAFVPGYELSGEVVEATNVEGCTTSHFCPGDRVVGLCYQRTGGLSTEVVCDSIDVWKVPSELKLKEATALILAHGTAYLGFTKYKPIDENSTILVSAGVGGRGLAAVDVAANLFKAKVIGLYDTEGRGSLLRDNGCFQTYSVAQKNLVKKVKEATNGKGLDLAYNAVGSSLSEIMLACLENSEDSLLLEVNPNTLNLLKHNAPVSKNDPSNENFKEKVIPKHICGVDLFDIRTTEPQLYQSVGDEILQYCSEQIISPHISKEFKLEDVNSAIEYIKTKQCTGKVLIHIQDE